MFAYLTERYYKSQAEKPVICIITLLGLKINIKGVFLVDLKLKLSDEFSLVAHRLDVLASLLRSHGETLPSMFYDSKSENWHDEVLSLVSDELERLSLSLYSESQSVLKNNSEKL